MRTIRHAVGAGFCICISIARAASGDLDTAFGDAGKVRIGTGGAMDSAYAMARQSDGKLIVAGQSSLPAAFGPDYQLSLARFNPNGSLDPTFGVNGIVQKPFASAGYHTTGIHALVILPDGKILAAGQAAVQLENDFVLLRYNADGLLDPSFGGGYGFISTDLGGNDFLRAMTVQADGKILLVGNSYAPQTQDKIGMARYNADGSPDTSFDGDGIRLVGLAYQVVSANAVRMQGTKIVVAGKVNTSGDVLLLRFNSDSSLDNTFDFDGIVVTPDAGDSEAVAMTFMATTAGSDTILLSGYSGANPAAWRYNLVDGSVDTTFGSGGKVVLPVDNSSATGIGIQTNLGVANRIIISGRRGNDVMVARLLLGGAPDTAFDQDGVVFTNINHNVASLSPSAAMLIQPADNKIVVAGTVSNPSVSSDSDYVILRYNAAGSLDTSFDTDGLKIQDVGNLKITAKSVAIQADGKIVAAGNHVVVRLNPNGSLDPSFNGNGKLTIANSVVAEAVAIQPDGKIVVVGWIEPGPGPVYHVLAVARYNVDGSPDTRFDGDGMKTMDNGTGYALAIQPDGKIVVAGDNGVANNSDSTVYRLDPNGSFDNSFGSNGIVVTPVAIGSDGATAVVLMANGKIVTAGFAVIGTGADFAAIVFNGNGSLDTSFNDDGIAFASIGATSEDRASAVAVQSGKILVFGTTLASPAFEQMAIMRYNPNGLLDTTFDNDGKITLDLGSSEANGNGMTLQADDKILLAGTTDNQTTGSDFTVVRLTVNGSLDASYGTGGKTVVHVSSGSFVNGIAIGNVGDDGYAIALDSAGNAVVAGQADAVFGLIRLKSSPAVFANISTRLRVETGDNVLIGGFIISGTQSKKIIVRAIGPSLPFAGALANPVLELRDSAGGLLAANDNWRSTQEADIIATMIPPGNDLESAIVALLPANNSAYTAIVRGVDNGTGIGVVEAYDLDQRVDSKLANISTRGVVQTGDDVMIGGLIVLGLDPLRVIVRAIGPSLPVSGALADPMLELRDGNGSLIASNDNWRTDQESEILATSIAPSNDLESAIVRHVAPGSYTAIVRGGNNTTGVAVVEAYGLN